MMLTAIQCFTILQTSSGRRRLLLTAIRSFTILHTLLGRRRRIILVRLFTLLYRSNGRRRVLSAMQCFTILQTSCGRRRFLRARQTFTITIIAAIKLIHHVVFEGTRIGEAAHPGPRLRFRGPRSFDSRSARRSRGGPAREIQEGIAESREKCLKMLHLNLRGYLSHIAETNALLRSM